MHEEAASAAREAGGDGKDDAREADSDARGRWRRGTA
jgi:hypothetical protein